MLNRPLEAPVKVVTFFNFTDMPFVGMWDKVEYPLAAGEKMKMEDWKAKHFAKHLVDQWCFANGKDNRRKEYWFIAKMAECIIESDSASAVTPGAISKLRTDLLADGMNQEYPKESDQLAAQRIVKQQPETVAQTAPKKKMGRPPKVKPDVAPVI